MKQRKLPGLRKQKSYSCLPYCSMCKTTLWRGNTSYSTATGRPVHRLCHACNTKKAYLYAWKMKAKEEVRVEISRLIERKSWLEELT